MAPTNNNKDWLILRRSGYPTEPIAGIPRPVDLIENVARSDNEDPNALSMKMPFETPLRSSERQAVLSHRRRTEEACPG
jgi:hypothetical protein